MVRGMPERVGEGMRFLLWTGPDHRASNDPPEHCCLWPPNEKRIKLKFDGPSKLCTVNKDISVFKPCDKSLNILNFGIHLDPSS